MRRRDSRSVTVVALCAEFPNDNSDLHAGTIWMSTEPCGGTVAHFAAEPPAPAPAVEVEPVVEVVEAAAEPEPAREVPSVAQVAPAEVEAAPAEPLPEPPTAETTDEEPHAEHEVTEPIEIVDSIVIDGPVEIVPMPVELEVAAVVAESSSPALPEEEPGDDEDDAYAVFIRKLAEVAVASGATMDAAAIDALLGTDAVAAAWRAILRGESEDFSTCGALDEWAAQALAGMMSAPQKVAQIRRELRARGVAAFGLIDAG
jgi:hypothetical protein